MLKHLKATKGWDDKNVLDKGFTLVELLVVIVILGILAAVVIFSVSGISDRGTTSACKADKQTIQAAIEAYRALDGHSGTDDPNSAALVPTFLNETSEYHTWTYTAHVPQFTAIGDCA